MTGGRLQAVVEFLHRVAGPSAEEAADGHLLRRFVTLHDEAAFALLLRRHGPMVLAVCRRMLRRSHDIEDAFQATFLVLARRAASIGHPHRLPNWLYGVAYRTALKARSLSARRHARERPLDDLDCPAPADGDAPDLAALLHEEISRLPEKYRSAFILCYLQGKTTAEAGKELHCPRGTVLSRLAWARARLRGRLTRKGIAPSAPVLSAALAAGARSALPRSLLDTTCASVRAFTASTTTTGEPAAPAAVLATGVLQSMMLGKCKMMVGSVLALALALLPLGLLGRAGWGAAAPREPAVSPVAEVSRLDPGIPKGWGLVTSRPEDLSAGLDRGVFHGGKASASLALAQGDEDAVTHLTQFIRADGYRGQRVRFTGWIKARELGLAAFPWMRVDGEEMVLQCDDHSRRTPIHGTGDWKPFAIVLDVDQSAVNLVLGFTLCGQGRAWVDDFRVEVVGQSVASTNQLEAEVRFGEGHQTELGLAEPTNLGFEELAYEPENAARDWLAFSSRKSAAPPTLELVFEGGGKPKSFAAVADTTVISYLADKPWGHLPWLALDLADRNRMLLRFDPKLDSKVKKAELVLHFTSVGEHPTPARPFGVAVHEVKEAWNEAAVTWEKQPSFVDKPAATVPVDPKAKEVRLDVTKLVQRLAEKDALRHGWLLRVAKPLKDENG
jgi:RNA polymerase sigma factor (sigma-70 family)